MTIWERLKLWRESRANLRNVARLDDRSRAEFETLVRLHRDGLEFKSKERSVVRGASADIAANAREAHS